ncbi:TERF1-interacting nuclear factor 2 isoform 5-T5 [Vipera latastei]
MGDGPAGEVAATAAVSLRVVAAAAWHVVRQRRFSDFPRVVTFLQSVAEAAPELVPFQHLAKLRLGLQAKIVMNMLKEDEPPGKIYHAVDTYFPENATPLGHTTATAQDLKMVQKAHEQFRNLMLKLLRDCVEREIYVQEFLERDYGEAFVEAMEELFCDYLCQLEHLLPEPQFQQALLSPPPPLPIRHAHHARARTRTPPPLRLCPPSQAGAEERIPFPASRKGNSTDSPRSTRKRLKIWCQIQKAKEAPLLSSTSGTVAARE